MHSVSSQKSTISVFGAPLFITGNYPQLLSKKLEAHDDLYSLPTIFGVIKTTIMICVGHVSRIGDRRGAHRDFVEKPVGKKTT
jgi:hypothetical protein